MNVKPCFMLVMIDSPVRGGLKLICSRRSEMITARNDREFSAKHQAAPVYFIASPPITHSDYYGIDTPERDQLLAATHTVEQMREFIGADSLAFISVEGIYRAMGYEGRDPARPQFTDHCFTGDYPTNLTDVAGETKSQLSLLAEVG